MIASFLTLYLALAHDVNHCAREGTSEDQILTDEFAGRGPDYIAMAGDIVSAYVSNNPVRPADLPELIASVHAAVAGLASGQPAGAAAETVEKPSPAEIRRSIKPEGITSFLDGKSYKTLKRHLTTHGLDPNSYRVRYGLPSDYPMVAAAYAAKRSALAKSIGLGVPGSRVEKAPEPDEFDQAAPEQAAPKGRRRKAA